MKRIRVEILPFCPKCGSKVDEGAEFCASCGASLRAETPRDLREERRERRRQLRYQRKAMREQRRYEKHEGPGYSFIGPLIGGLFLILLGFTFYLQISGYPIWQLSGATFLIIIGVLIIAAAIYTGRAWKRVQPRT